LLLNNIYKLFFQISNGTVSSTLVD